MFRTSIVNFFVDSSWRSPKLVEGVEDSIYWMQCQTSHERWSSISWTGKDSKKVSGFWKANFEATAQQFAEKMCHFVITRKFTTSPPICHFSVILFLFLLFVTNTLLITVLKLITLVTILYFTNEKKKTYHSYIIY